MAKVKADIPSRRAPSWLSREGALAEGGPPAVTYIVVCYAGCPTRRQSYPFSKFLLKSRRQFGVGSFCSSFYIVACVSLNYLINQIYT